MMIILGWRSSGFLPKGQHLHLLQSGHTIKPCFPGTIQRVLRQLRLCWVSWSFSAGFEFSKDLEDQIIEDLCDTRIKRRGLSLSGGEPLHPNNFDAVYSLLLRIRNECPPHKDVWLWTGYTLDQLTTDQKRIVDLVDVLIDGKFIESQKDRKLLWRGSSNQVINRFDRSDAWWKKTKQE